MEMRKENNLTEHMLIEKVRIMDVQCIQRGRCKGLILMKIGTYIVGESDGKHDSPQFKLVVYKGHTLKGEIHGI